MSSVSVGSLHAESSSARPDTTIGSRKAMRSANRLSSFVGLLIFETEGRKAVGSQNSGRLINIRGAAVASAACGLLLCGLLFSVVPLVEALAGLFAELAFGDHATQYVGRSEALRAEPRVEVVGDVESHVKADEIGQAERPHRVIVTEFHRRIYIFRVGHALLNHAHRLKP